MKPLPWQINELKSILENIHTPARLDNHPWTRSLVFQEEVSRDPSLAGKSAGYQLLAVLSRLFRKMMPSTPPRRGKRLDTRWCQFGMLAAQYFAPFLFGSVYPPSLREAWGRVDQVLPLFVFGKSAEELSEQEAERYRLFGDDEEPAPYSTLSDWHIKGLQHLADVLLTREQYLHHTLALPSPVLDASQQEAGVKREMPPSLTLAKEARRGQLSSRAKRLLRLAVIFIVLLLVAGIGFKGWRVHQRLQVVRQDMNELETLTKGQLDLDALQKAGALLSQTHQDVEALSREAAPFLWAGRYLGWVPVYGGDLEASGPLLEMARSFTLAAEETYQGVQPLEDLLTNGSNGPKLAAFASTLVAIQPRLTAAKSHLDRALEIRSGIDVQRLSPSFRNLVVKKVDPYAQKLNDGLTVLLAAPKLLGASQDGPQTYLLLLQNEDELRATGGFVTGVGAVVIHNGDIVSFNFEDSYNVDDWSKPYPSAPKFLRDYMNIRAVTLRDSNWNPNFPATAALAEYLYAYTRFHSVDGVIAVDQHFFVSLLKVLGPLEEVQDVPFPITAENVIEYMRSQKLVYESTDDGERIRKTFFGKIAEALLTKIQTAPDLPWQALQKVFSEALEERHLLIQLDERSVAALLRKQGWDGAVLPGAGDFLLVVDSNVGYTKGNPLVEEAFSYTVDLSDLQQPTATLTISQKNNAPAEIPCIHWNPTHRWEEDVYEIQMKRCYWDYLRIYKPVGTTLVSATPHAIPGEWMILGEDVPARVDLLEEGIEGVQGFGTLVVIPGGAALDTNFTFALPPQVLAMMDADSIVYSLRIQKQAGTLAIPITIRVRLPQNAVVLSAAPAGEAAADGWQWRTTLRRDVEIRIEFRK